MKKTLFLTAVLSAFAFCNAQTNLVQNPGFENGTDPWSKGPTNTYTVPQISTNAPHSGTSCAAYSPITATTGFYQTITLIPGHEYKLSFWYKSTSTGGTTQLSGVRIWSGYLTSATTVSSPAGVTDPNDPLKTNNGYLPTATDWTQCTVTFTADALAENNPFAFAVRVYIAAGNAYFDDFSLVDMSSLGVQDVNAGKTQVVLAPTLVDNQISVLLSGKSNVDFYNINGALVKSVTVNAGESINASDLQAGVYFVKVANGGKTQVVKIVKK